MPDNVQSIDLKPFPTLHWDGDDWNGSAVLAAWAGFQSRQGSYASQDSQGPSSGTVIVRVLSPEVGQPVPPSPAQVKAFQQLLDQQTQIRDAMLAALLAHYDEVRPDYEEFLGDEFEELMPEVTEPAEFRELIGLGNVFVLATEKDGLAYLGYELGCTWDIEHGIGFLLHGQRVVDVGGADTAFLGWNAEEDAEG
jgi:hypothetical protein